ncbi:TetR/AcrR family transcriptional regulator [Nocardioides albus]|uniref:AcrR family transcriptional regulator n=1 Tax=Nocardioides albus TaxID=1841 RepID=A0A7W5A0K7_9ACTN|nr:TetR/AcrR family transcriptional regulator [Nocardioides albus]MBB3087289.1 AcrR family transcriptional regulator [Nocardioides albus]GGU07911.1 putative regulatory protein, TetR [Nocardioides albus]
MPRIAAESVPEHRRLVRERIFAAFAELMVEGSYDAISMSRLAERAGIGRTAIYHHFKDRDAVMVAFATHETSEYVASLQAQLAVSEEPAERLRIYVRNHITLGERFHMGFGPQVYGALPEEARQEIREHVVAVEQVLAGILEQGAEQGIFAVTDVDATISLIHAVLGARRVPAERVEEFVLRAVGAS